MGHLRIRHLARTNRNALGGKGFGGNIFVAHGGNIFAISVSSLTSSFPVFFSFPSHGKSADLCSWAWLRPWLSTPGSVFTSLVVGSGLHWACVTHCTTICAILTIDDLEKREACRCRSCPWLLTGITEQGNGKLSTSFLGGIPRCSRLCPWENGRNACVKHCFVVHLRSLSTHSSICFYFAVAVLHSDQPGFQQRQLLLVRSSFFVW